MQPEANVKSAAITAMEAISLPFMIVFSLRLVYVTHGIAANASRSIEVCISFQCSIRANFLPCILPETLCIARIR
jgi:hypothetical protein